MTVETLRYIPGFLIAVIISVFTVTPAIGCGDVVEHPGWLDPFFIMDGLIHSVHYDRQFYSGISRYKNFDKMLEERQMETTDVESEWNKYLGEIGKNAVFIVPRQGYYKDINTDDFDADAKEYFQFISDGEYISPWQQKKNYTGDELEHCIEKAEKVKSIKPGFSGLFLSKKWAYQAVKYAYKTEEYNTAIKLYEKYFASDKTNEISKIRAMGYYALSFAKLRNKQIAIDLYVLMYDSYIPYRSDIRTTLIWPRLFIDKDYEIFYRSSVSNHKKATLAFILNDVSKLVELEPDSPRTTAAILKNVMMLEREWLRKKGPIFIKNKKENKKFVEKLKSFFTFKSEVDESLKEYEKYLKNLIKSSSKNTEVRELLLAYVYMLEGKQKETDDLLEKIENNTDTDKLIKNQARIIGILNSLIKQNSGINEDIQEETAEIVTWLENERGGFCDSTDKHNNSINCRIKENLLILCGNRFFYSGDYVRAAACFGTDSLQYSNLKGLLLDYYAKPGELETMQSYIDNEQPLDKYLKKFMNPKISDKHKCYANWYFMNKKFKEAVEEIKKCEDIKRNELYMRVLENYELAVDPQTGGEPYFKMAEIFFEEQPLPYWNKYHSYGGCSWVIDCEVSSISVLIAGVSLNYSAAAEFIRKAIEKEEDLEKKIEYSVYEIKILRKAKLEEKAKDAAAECIKKYSNTEYYKNFFPTCSFFKDISKQME